MRTVNIGIRHDHDLVIAKFAYIEIISISFRKSASKCIDHSLGEMDAEQLWETKLNPETRRMKRVEIEDARLASSVTEVLMGSEVPPRKAFIYEHAADAELDV